MICGQELKVCENCKYCFNGVDIGTFCSVNGKDLGNKNFMVRIVKSDETCKKWEKNVN